MTKRSYPKKVVDGKKITLHRLEMEKHLQRPLETNEHVYHIDGNHLNNDIDNLIVIKKKYREFNGN
jgi:hypothetical protein